MSAVRPAVVSISSIFSPFMAMKQIDPVTFCFSLVTTPTVYIHVCPLWLLRTDSPPGTVPLDSPSLLRSGLRWVPPPFVKSLNLNLCL